MLRCILLVAILALPSLSTAQTEEERKAEIARQVLRFYEVVPEYRSIETPLLNKLLLDRLYAKNRPVTAEALKLTYHELVAEALGKMAAEVKPPKHEAVSEFVDDFLSNLSRSFAAPPVRGAGVAAAFGADPNKQWERYNRDQLINEIRNLQFELQRLQRQIQK